MILDFLHIGWGNLYVIGHPAWLQKAKQGRPTTAKFCAKNGDVFANYI
jgi:hypothetical protein